MGEGTLEDPASRGWGGSTFWLYMPSTKCVAPQDLRDPARLGTRTECLKFRPEVLGGGFWVSGVTSGIILQWLLIDSAMRS